MAAVRSARILGVLLIMVGVGGAMRFPARTLAQSSCAVSGGELAIDQEEQAALDALNAGRSERGLATLSLSPALGRAAAWKAGSMAASGAIAHDDGGRSWIQRSRDCGYTASTRLAENLAMGPVSGQAAVQMWLASPPHHRNAMDPTMRAAGIARVQGTGAMWFWIAIFGGAVDGPAAEPEGRIPSATPNAAPPPAFTAGAPPVLPARAASALQAGVTARVVAGAGDCLNLRAAPSTAAPVLRCLPDGATVTVTAGPQSAGGMGWWQVDGAGWVAGEFLTPSR